MNLARQIAEGVSPARQIADAVVMLAAEQHVTFADLALRWPEHFHNGRFCIFMDPVSLLWKGFDEVGLEVVNILRREQRVSLSMTHESKYAISVEGIEAGVRWVPTVMDARDE